MKKIFWINPIIFAAVILFFATHCKKEEPAKLQGISKSNANSNTPVISITDADSNTYNTVTIGSQCWMAENLKTKTYLNGDPILSNLSGSEWTNTTSGAYQISSDIYGNLYNAYAVADERHICPAGWHVPSASEWDELLIYLGGEENAGGSMKETGTSHWLDPNVGATNESGFTALPA